MVGTYQEIKEGLSGHGLTARGGFWTGPKNGDVGDGDVGDSDVGDATPETCGTVILVGNTGPEFWAHFEAGRHAEDNPLDAWTKRVVDHVAASAGGWAVYPSDGPPYFPFQRWAQKVEPVSPSPIGLLIHADFGLWHAYRAAICLHSQIEVPAPVMAQSPCLSCIDQPCLTACPVEAFDSKGYNVSACADHMRISAGADCLSDGCRARHACPIAGPHLYAPGQAGFHMQAFLTSRDREAADAPTQS